MQCTKFTRIWSIWLKGSFICSITKSMLLPGSWKPSADVPLLVQTPPGLVGFIWLPGQRISNWTLLGRLPPSVSMDSAGPFEFLDEDDWWKYIDKTSSVKFWVCSIFERCTIQKIYFEEESLLMCCVLISSNDVYQTSRFCSSASGEPSSLPLLGTVGNFQSFQTLTLLAAFKGFLGTVGSFQRLGPE